VNCKDKDGGTSLISAVAIGAAGLVRDLLEKHADVDAQDNDGHTALMIAATLKGQALMIAATLKGQAKTQIAIEQAIPQIVDDFLAKNPDVNRQKKDGWTALMFAAARDHPEFVNALIAHGANPNLKNTQGMTALALAVNNRHARIVALLQRAGAA
jgi:ankyrin repeat protein